MRMSAVSETILSFWLTSVEIGKKASSTSSQGQITLSRIDFSVILELYGMYKMEFTLAAKMIGLIVTNLFVMDKYDWSCDGKKCMHTHPQEVKNDPNTRS